MSLSFVPVQDLSEQTLWRKWHSINVCGSHLWW